MRRFDEREPLSPKRAFATAVLIPSLCTTVAMAAPFAIDVPRAVVFIAPLTFLIAFPVILLAAAAIGLPLTKLLERHRLERGWVYALAGLFCGTVLMYAYFLVTGQPASSIVLALLVGGLNGALSGAIWWRKYRRFDASVPSAT